MSREILFLGSAILNGAVTEDLNTPLDQTNLNDGLGPDVVRESSPSVLNPNPKTALQDISNTLGQATKARPKKGKSPKAKLKGVSDAARVSKSDLKRSLPPHNEADIQSQKRRVVIPHESLSPETILTVVVPQPRRLQ